MASGDDENTAPERVVCIDLRKCDRATVSAGRIESGSELKLCAAVRCRDDSPAFGVVGVYLLRVEGAGAVPSISWELRARYGAEDAEPITGASGLLGKLSTWEGRGSVVFAGRPVTGWELWASNDGATAIPCGVRFVVGPVGASASPWSENGELV